MMDEMPAKNAVERIADKLERHGARLGIPGYRKAFIWDAFTIGIFIFVLAIALPIMSQIGQHTAAVVVTQGNLNVSQAASLTTMSNNMFLNAPDIIVFLLYCGLILASFIASSYEGANPAVTLLLGMFFLIIAIPISFSISNTAHAYMTQTSMLNMVKHYSLTLYIMDYLPLLNGIFIIADIVYVISKKEVVMEGMGYSAGGYGGGVISQ